MSNLENFDRQYRLIIGKADQSGVEIGDTQGGKVAPLHISFSLQKSDLTTQNTGRVSIWNLSKTNLSLLEQKDCVVSLKAGYGQRLSEIFSGIVSHAVTSLDGSDRMTEVEVVDNLVEIRDTFVSISYRGQVSWKTIFTDAADAIGVVIVFGHNVTFSSVTNGFSFIGQAKEILNKGCESCGLTWSLQNGIIHITKPGGTISTEVYVISPDSGMIGIPSRVCEAATEEGGTPQIGWDVEYLMNGAINVNDFVKLDCKTVTGYFRVHSIECSGDNVSGDWYCRARVLEVTAQ